MCFRVIERLDSDVFIQILLFRTKHATIVILNRSENLVFEGGSLIYNLLKFKYRQISTRTHTHIHTRTYVCIYVVKYKNKKQLESKISRRFAIQWGKTQQNNYKTLK